MKARVIIDLNTNRIIYFTMDEKAVLHSNPKHNMIVDFDGEWPLDITLSNCWEYTLRRGVVQKNATTTLSGADLVSRNKEALKNLLSDIIAEKRKPFVPSSILSLGIRAAKLDEAKRVVAGKGVAEGWLKNFADSRSISLMEAATIILKRKQDEDRVLMQTEKQRENLVGRIEQSTDTKQLDALREEILLLRS